MTTPADLLSEQLARDGARPLFTFYDDETGERVELSVATTANWVAKTANYLVDEHGVDAGDVVAVRLPVHWQAAVILLAAWAVGAQVSFDDDEGAVVSFGTGVDPPERDSVVLSLAPMGADFSRLVAAQPDDFVADNPAGEDLVAATAIDLPHAARVLSVLPYDGAAALSYALIGPLAVDGSIVLVRHAAPAALAERVRAERVTRCLGIDVAGVPRLDSG